MSVPRVKAGLGIEILGVSCETSRPSSSLQRASTYSSSSQGGEHGQDGPLGSLRSIQGMQGLLSAEKGEGMVEFDIYNQSSGFREGQRVEAVTPGGSFNNPQRSRSQPAGPRHPPSEYQPTLVRQDTMLGHAPRKSKDLKSLLGDSHAKLKYGAAVALPNPHSIPGDSSVERVTLEQAKSHARVEVCIVLESNTYVQGDCVKGTINVRIRKHSRHEPRILVAEGRLRILGFELIPHVEDRHTFYQISETFSKISPNWDIAFDSSIDEDGFAYAKEGNHVLPFTMYLPVEGNPGNSKGILYNIGGVSVKYIAMVSVKVKDAESGKRSIAHFYRDCEIWPRLDPSTVLSSAPRPLRCTASKSLFMGGSGKARLTALLHRLYWVAGQRCYVKLFVENETKKTIKRVSIALVRKTTMFRPSPGLDTGNMHDPDACQTATSYKEVTESTLEMAQRVTKGHASTKGWWTGVAAGQTLEFSHFVLLPPEALSVARGRLLEVEFSLRVSISAGSLTSDVFVDLPIRIINFLSIDFVSPFSVLPVDDASRTSSAFSRRDHNNLGATTSETFSNNGTVEDEVMSAENHDSLGALGNLDEAHNSDEEINIVIGTASVDQGENSVGFSSNFHDGNAQTPTDDIPPSIAKTHTGFEQDIPLLQRRQSNCFAMRVQEKLANIERAVVAQEDDLSNDDPTTPKSRPADLPRHSSDIAGVQPPLANFDNPHKQQMDAAPISSGAIKSFLSGSSVNSSSDGKQASSKGSNFDFKLGAKAEGDAGEKDVATSDVKRRIQELEAKMRNA